MTPFKAPPDYPKWAEVAALIHRAFAYMEPILGHKPAAAKVTEERLVQGAEIGSAYIVEDAGRPVASLFTRPSRDFPDALFVGGLAVDKSARGQGLARKMMVLAEAEARQKGYAALTLDTGRALTDLHALFLHLGFEEVPGTGDVITFRKPLA
ncbi:MAG: GNAT family N-acetyltransferase [Pseudomonadota bacterium]